ncbi:S9 family peptidase [Croceicoccus sp. YJ47]|uniref:alpha/beta hydrolase family protein n=1 Tax=Croceicoccus sp. YJ47 TaxID=2798724 RepID=UPI001920A81F|nr:alpha/beta hydrolase [Croceicoccus sp. YJ47]QQN73207.1 alpha/beta hydrolase [Croceicoccus sp. YJ47]
MRPAIAQMPGMMEWPDLLHRPRPLPDGRIAYGRDGLQHVDVWLPRARARNAAGHPVVVMVHGGCWQTDVARAGIMNYIADDLRRRGIAVWNLEYRGVDRPGGGYPGTFRDVGRGSDMLRERGAALGIDTAARLVFGHSAGGHLALWLAARHVIAPRSPLFHPDPLRFGSAICAGGLPDLRAARVAPGNTCGTEAVDALLGADVRDAADLFADCSPADMMPFATHQTLINTGEDHIAPPSFAAAYAAKADAADAEVTCVTVPDEGHVELIAPGTAAWAAACGAIFDALKPGDIAP